MKFKYCILKLYIYFSIFPTFFEEIINNPIKTEKEFNPIDYKIIFKTQNMQVQASSIVNLILVDRDLKFIHDSYVISQTLAAGYDDEDDILYLYMGDKSYYLTLDQNNNIKTLKNKYELASNVQFTDYIISPHNFGFPQKDAISAIERNEVILYRKTGQNIYFYYIKEKVGYTVHFGNIDEHISCKNIIRAIYICAFSENNQVKLKVLAKVYLEDGQEEKELRDIGDIIINEFNNHDSAALFDTKNENYKILCAREKISNNIECKAIESTISNSVQAIGQISLSSDINYYELNNEYEATFSFNENNCNFTKYEDEYLICCGITNSIVCDKRDLEFNLINTFSVPTPGKITNVTFEISEDNIKLIYSNETSSEKGIYEHYIYYPDCNDFNISLNSYESKKVLIDELFERKTNTKFYIALSNSYVTYYSIKINNVEITDDSPVLLKERNNYMYFSTRSGVGSKIFKYNISIAEVFSKVCNVYIVVKSCYTSCRNCSKSKDNSDSENHNCLFCKNNYFPFTETGTNCYNKEEVNTTHQDWYFDETKKFFDLCNSACKTCYGPTEENCSSCPFDEFGNQLFLFSGKCITDCPIGTFKNLDTNECENCYENCKSCSQSGTPSRMNCDSCFNNQIIHGNGCYNVHNDLIKSFFKPESSSEITSCKEYFGLYIKDDTYVCIEDIEEGYFISNSITGLLSRCDSNCKTCSQSSIHCDSCENGLYLQEGICVSNCGSQYYLDGTSCIKCYDNCLTCSSGKQFDETGKLISMGCSKCIDDESTEKIMIKIEEYCFPIIDYEETKITFDISEIDNDNTIGNCLNLGKSIFYNSYECISKPVHTFYVLTDGSNTGVIKNCNVACDTCLGESDEHNTNCIICAEGYFKTEDSTTNCILESLIPDNYYKNEEDNIYYKKIPSTQIILESCQDNLYLTPTGTCVSTCPLGTYKYSLNYTCLESCPNNYKINEEHNECILIINEETSSSSISKSQSSNDINNGGNNNFDNDIKIIISDFISKNLNSSMISENEKIKVVLTVSSTSLKEQLKTSSSAIDLGDCTNTLKNYYNIQDEQDLIILNKESNNNNENSTLNNNNEIEVYDFSGRKLNLSICQEEITLIKYIGGMEELNIETAMDYAELGIDIYNASFEFFNDLCYQYDNEDRADITMEDRRNEVYQNVSFCQNGCSYGGIDYELMTVKCICNANSLQSEKQNTTDENDQSKLSHFESLVKTFI